MFSSQYQYCRISYLASSVVSGTDEVVNEEGGTPLLVSVACTWLHPISAAASIAAIASKFILNDDTDMLL